MMKNAVFILFAALSLLCSQSRARDVHSTGLILPSAADIAAFEDKYPMPAAPLGVSLPARVVNSAYLPPVANGNQGQVGICGSICITYFTATHQLAKARGWNAPGRNGDWSKVTSPAWGVWCYRHGMKDGLPWGANPFETIEEIIRSGIRSWEDYPYTGAALDVSYLPGFAERAAALRWRAKTAVAIGDIHSPSGIRSLKHFLAQGNIAATSTEYVDTLRNCDGPNVSPGGVVVATGDSEFPGHALTIVGYDDAIAYTDPKTGAVKHGAFLVVNSWGEGWGYSVPEVGTGGFLWIPYDLPFLSGAYSLNFPAEDAAPELYAKVAVVDADGNWTSSVIPNARWFDICQVEAGDPSKEPMSPPVVNGYAPPTNRYVRVMDAGDLFNPDFPSITLSIMSGAGAETPEGEIEFSLYGLPDDQSPPLIDENLSIWGYFPYRRKVTICPLPERVSDLGVLVKYGGMASADLDGDGAEEFVVAYLEGSGAKRFKIARNDGSGNYTLASLPGDGARAGQPLLVDLDNDGDLDLVHSSREQTDLLFNNGSGSFSLAAETLPAGGMGGGAAVADFNGDGRPDLLLANMAEGLLLMRQLPDGSFEKTRLGRSTPESIVGLGVDSTCVAAGDVNGDGMPDFVFWEETREGYAPEKLVLGINLGGLQFSYRILPTPDNLQSVALALGDFDQDGCDDLAWSGCSYPAGSLSYRQARFGVLRGSPGGWMNPVPIAPDLKPICGGGIAWADLNNDGRLDLVMTGRENDSSLSAPTVAGADQGFYRNHFYLLRYDSGYFVEGGFNLTGVTGSHRGGLLAPLDIDGDGDLDLFSAGYRGPMSSSPGADVNADLYFTAFYENTFDSFALTRSTNSPPTLPSNFSAVPSANQVQFTWSGATDAETASAGLRYQLQAGTTPGGCDLMSRVLDPQNIGLLQKSGAVLRDVPAGTVYWRVRTVDPASAVSPWSAVQTVAFPTSLAKSRVRIAAAEGGACTPGAGEHLVASGGSLLLSAQPAAGWQFDGWLVNGTSESSNPYALTPSGGRVDVVPQFSEKGGTSSEVEEWSRVAGPADFMNRFGFTDYAAVALNGYLYCFPGYGAAQKAWRTSNGTTWQSNDFMGQSWFTLPYADAVAWNGKIWLVAEATVYSAVQGAGGALSWSTKTSSAPWGSVNMQLAVFNGELWAVNASGGGTVWSSSDGISWTQETTAPWPARSYNRLVVAGDTLLAIVSSASYGSSPGEVWGSSDGENWTQRCAAAPWALDGAYIAAVWFDGAVHVTGMQNDHFVSADGGVSWIKVHPTGSETSHFTSASAYGSELTVFNNDLYLIGYEEDSEDWTASVYWKLAPSPGGGTTMYALNISVNGEGGSTMPPAGVWFDEAGTYPVEARPAPGYAFVSWSGPVADPASAATSVQLASNTVVVANFQAMGNDVATPGSLPLVTSVIPAGSGHVGQSGNYNVPATQVLADGSTKVTAVPAAGWAFSHWLGDGAAEMLSANTAVIPAGAATVELTACFRPAAMSSVSARGDTSRFIDNAGRQWLWGANRFGIAESMWNSPDGGIPPYAFTAVDFWIGALAKFELGADGTVRQSGSLRFLEHRFVQVVSAGSGDWLYSLSIDRAGRVWSWGSNAYGQLGDGTQTDRDAPVAVLLPEAETFVKVCAGETFGMALSLSGKVYVWGANSSGQTGSSGLVNPLPLEMAGLPVARDIAAGTAHALALGADGLVYGWGANTYGQSSGRRGADRDAPVAVENLSAAMQSHQVSIRMEDIHGNPPGEGGGTIVPQGEQLLRAYAEFFVEAGDGARYSFDHWDGPAVDPPRAQSTAKAMPNAAITAVFALKTETLPTLTLSMNHPEAAMMSPSTGTTAFAWGERVELVTRPHAGWRFDRWIIDGETNLNAAVELTLDRDVAAEAFYSTVEFRTQPVPGLLNSWGQPANYDSSNRSIIDPNYAGPLFADAALTSFNGFSRLYLGADGTVWYVDSVPDGMERVPGETPDVPYLTGVTKIVSDGGFMLAVRSDGTIWVWGNVPGAAAPLERPVQVAGLDAADFSQIIAVRNTLLFLRTNGTVASWGLDVLLTGTGAQHASLTAIPGLSNVVELAGNSFSVLALKGDGTVWGWGENSDEMLGLSRFAVSSRSTPVQVSGLSGIAKLFSCGFARDNLGRIWVWGLNAGGCLGLGIDAANQSILPPVLHPSFPSGAVGVSRSGDGYTSVRCADGSVWRAGNAHYWIFTRLDTEHLIVDTYEETPVHRRLTIAAEPTSAAWISHLPGTHRCMDNDRVLLWANPPITVQCDGWLVDGLPVVGSSVTLFMDRDHAAEPLFSPRPKIELPAPTLRIADAVADASLSNATVQIPITLSGQDYIIPDALQFTLHVPGELPEPTLAVPDEWAGVLDVVTETYAVTNGINLKVLMLGTNDLFAAGNMTIGTLGFNVGDVPQGDYAISLLEAGPVMLAVASEDDGSIAIPLETADGTLRLDAGDQCAMKLLLTPNPTAADSLTDTAMQALSDLDALRGDRGRYAEVWLRCDSADELYACSYNLALSGSATFVTNRQYFINEPDIASTVGVGGQSLTGMGGPISDEKIISHNDYAAKPYESGDWMLIARMPLAGGSGSSTLAMTDIRVELFEADGNETFILPDQTRNLTVAPNAAPTSASLSISTTSLEFVRIQPEIHDVNPQDIAGIGLMILRHPTSGRVMIDPENPRGFIYHPPENGVFSGTVSFQFALTDGTDQSATYTAEITVNNPPQFVGIPKVIHCGTVTNLSLTVQVIDADTPPEQLQFSLHNAPHWLSIVNNGDGSAVIGGMVPPTRDTWSVFAVQVGDPLSRATSQATLLLTFDPAVGGVLLTVVDGMGGGLFEAGAVLQISARSPGAGEQFSGWGGDVQYLDNAQSPTPTVTLPDHDITLRAVFIDPSASSGFSAWAASYGLTDGQDGPSDTPAGDRISNLEKYAFGLIPTQAYNPGTLFSMRIDAASGRMVLRYEQSKQATDVRIVPIWSASLTEPAWSSTLIQTTRVGETDTHEIWEASMPMSHDTCFMRLRFDLQSASALTFVGWAGSFDLANGQNGPSDTPAGDRISNLEKYTFGLIPTQVYNPGDLFGMRIDAASRRMILRYEQSKQATDVRIVPIWSASLTEPVWNTTRIETVRVGETDTHEIWEASMPMTDDACFMRLRFEL